MSTPVVVAIIPARGGSKGVPGKNLRPVGGVPLVARAVHAAAAAEGVDLVVVSTDDGQIADVAIAAGARVVTRPAAIAGDSASSESAILHALEVLGAEGVAVSTVVFVQATSPFISSSAIAQGVVSVATGGFDTAFSAYETYGFLWRRTRSGAASAINHDASFRPRRQDREPHYMETGAFYVFGAEAFRREKHRFFGKTAIIEVPESSAVEIDDLDQFAIASAISAVVDKPARIEVDAVVTDFDGVHTDDTATVDAAGVESVRVSRSDGMGVSLLRKAGIPMLILSTETNPVVRARAEKLQVEVLHGIDNKAEALAEWARRTGVALERVAYLGNDVNDVAVMATVGWPIAVADSHPDAIAAARIVLKRRGGDGAVRELIERVLAR